MYKVFDRVKVALTTVGTGNLTLGAALEGFQTWADAGGADSDNVAYAIEDVGGAWEIGWGQLGGAGTVLSRNVIASSSAGAALNLSGNAVIFSAINKSLFDGKLGVEGGAVTGTIQSSADLMVEGTGGGLKTIRASGSGSQLVLEQTGGQYGGTRLTILNETGANGATFENMNIDLVDFGFKTPSGQRNIRYEARAGAQIGGNVSWEFQFGASISEAACFAIGDTEVYSTKPISISGNIVWHVGNFDPTSKLDASQKGVANGVASLDSGGLVPAAQLPSYVDDVLEYSTLSAFPNPGVSGKIYVAMDTSAQYRWSGTTYIELVASPGTTDNVPEGSTNLYFTNARASAAAPVQSVAGKTGAVVLAKGDVGLANVDNTSDANKPVSAAQQSALDAKKDKAPAIQAVTSAGTVTPTFSNDQVNITAQAAALTLANPSGTAVDGWGISIRIKDSGTAQTIAYGTQYRAIGVTLPTTTVAGKTLYLGMIYNAADTKWDVVAVAQEA